MELLSDEVFEREKRAYEMVKAAIEHMMENNYEPHIFDNPPNLELDVVFISWDKETNGCKDAKKLRIPYGYLTLLINEDEETKDTFVRLTHEVREATERLNNFLLAALTNKLEGLRNGRDSSGRKKEYQA